MEPYGFFLVKALREYHDALGRGLLSIVSALFKWKCNQTKCDIRKCQNIFFPFIKAPFDDLNTFLKCIWNKNLFVFWIIFTSKVRKLRKQLCIPYLITLILTRISSRKIVWTFQVSNPRPPVCESSALPLS